MTHAESPQPKRSERTCVGCHALGSPGELVRFVLGPDGSVQPELNKHAGRGAWVHPRPECLRDACRKGFAKSFRAPVTARPETLAALLVSGLVRRSRGLLGAALAARKLAVGASEVKDALALGQARLVVVARDARAAAGSSEVEQAIRAGRARAFATKDELGAITRRNETGVVAVLDAGIAEALEKSIDWASQLASSASAEVGGDASTEE